MHRTTRLSLAAAAALAATAPTALAQAPAPTITLDRACYSEGDAIAFQGSGFTPGGAVDLLFGARDRFGSFLAAAGPDGAVAGEMPAPDPDAFLADDEADAELFLTANDRTRVDAGAQPPESQFAATQFVLSRWGVYYSGAARIRPARPITWEAYGFTGDVGRTLYAHFRRGGRTLATVAIGKLDAPCGDVSRRFRRAFPMRKVPSGRYTIVFNTSRGRATAGPNITYRVRV